MENKLNKEEHSWRYHVKKPLSFIAVLPACMLYVDLVLGWILMFKSYLFISYIALFAPLLLIPACVVAAIHQLLKKNIKNFIFIMLPLIIVGYLLISSTSDNTIMTRSRDQAEFLIQKYLYIPEIADISNGKAPEVTYKEWSISSGMPNRDFWIIYDVTDEIAKKDGLKIPSGSYTDRLTVYHIEGHFYMVSRYYPGKIWY